MKNLAPRSGRSSRRAVTLIELLIVISIIAILAGLAGAAAVTLLKKSDRDTTYVLIKSIGVGLERYRNTFGNWPDVVLTSTPDPADATYLDDCKVYIRSLAKLKDVLLDAEVVQPSKVQTAFVIPRHLAGKRTGDRIVVADALGRPLGAVVDAWGNPINVIRGGFNQPGLDIWSNGADEADDRNPNDRRDYGDDVVSWGGR